MNGMQKNKFSGVGQDFIKEDFIKNDNIRNDRNLKENDFLPLPHQNQNQKQMSELNANVLISPSITSVLTENFNKDKLNAAGANKVDDSVEINAILNLVAKVQETWVRVQM